MGYSTEFAGVLRFGKEPTVAVLRRLREIEGTDGRERTDEAPGSYNQWEVTSDLSGLEWDGGEKFSYYVEWMQWILDTILKPAGIALVGELSYQGEESGDAGELKVLDGVVVIKKHSDVIADLEAFRDFVVKRRDGAEIVAAFNRQQRERPRP